MGKKPTELQIKREECKDILRSFIEGYGDWEVNITKFSKEWNVPKSTVHRWKDEVVDELGAINFKSAGRDISRATQSSIKWLNRIVKSKDRSYDEKFKAFKLFLEGSKGFMDLAEQYGDKDKVAEKLEVKSDAPELKRIQDTYAKVRKNLKKK